MLEIQITKETIGYKVIATQGRFKDILVGATRQDVKDFIHRVKELWQGDAS